MIKRRLYVVNICFEKGLTGRIMIFDTHAHYDDEQFDSDREALLGSFQENGVMHFASMGVDMANSRNLIKMLDEYPYMYAAVGVHPNEVASLTMNDLDELKELAKHERVVAIGEIGLDYYYPEPPKDIQIEWFVRQCEVARELKLPICIHSRDAAKDTIDTLRRIKAQEIGGVVHCYSYSKESAKDYLDMGFFFGIGGVVTFKNAKKLKEAVEYIPLDRIVLETDCPYLAPEPYRGKRNTSLYIPYMIKAIADIKNVSSKEVEEVTYNNALRLYKLI